ncbi:hypothetical protein PoB_000936500 [Plakobranchus ocellatus]|uniref:Uncharacterized protein n=1 Tax=Plakobranchus ocellatus TaxID=259542 RepID=A0AAV3YJF1_9GAST|nr:hypothetical protein PoB_000936500 [Plakobranchus ocellatus]
MFLRRHRVRSRNSVIRLGIPAREYLPYRLDDDGFDGGCICDSGICGGNDDNNDDDDDDDDDVDDDVDDDDDDDDGDDVHEDL